MATMADAQANRAADQLLNETMTSPKGPKALKMILYGDWGSSKTIFSTKFTRSKNFMVASENGWKVLDEPRHKAEREVTTVVPYKGIEVSRAVANSISTGRKPYDQYDTFIIDTMTGAEEDTLDLLIQEKQYSDRPDPLVSSWTDYKMSAGMWRPTILDFWNLPNVNVIITCHLREYGEKAKVKGPKIQPRLADALLNFFGRDADFICLLKTMSIEGKQVRTVQCNENEEFVAKRRGGDEFAPIMTQKAFIKEINRWRDGETG